MACKEVTINGTIYVPKETKTEGMRYVIIRSARAGVFAGYLKEQKDQTCVLMNSRWIWYWEGAATLSQLCQEGVAYPTKCKFPCEVPEQTIFEVIQILETTLDAKKSIDSVPVWKI